MNKIVKIVHECAKRWNGLPAKNYGDKYLITWKLPKENKVNQSYGMEGPAEESEQRLVD